MLHYKVGCLDMKLAFYRSGFAMYGRVFSAFKQPGSKSVDEGWSLRLQCCSINGRVSCGAAAASTEKISKSL